MPCTCLSVVSSWVAFACVVDGKLTLVFRDGDAIEYPGRGDADFRALVLSGSPGHFVNTALKGEPHRKVVPPLGLVGNPPVLAGTCLVCRTLHATCSFEYADVTLGPVRFALTYDPGTELWSDTTDCDGQPLTMRLWYDAALGFRWNITGMAVPDSNWPLITCEPHYADGAHTTNHGYCGHASAAVQINLVGTE